MMVAAPRIGHPPSTCSTTTTTMASEQSSSSSTGGKKQQQVYHSSYTTGGGGGGTASAAGEGSVQSPGVSIHPPSLQSSVNGGSDNDSHTTASSLSHHGSRGGGSGIPFRSVSPSRPNGSGNSTPPQDPPEILQRKLEEAYNLLKVQNVALRNLQAETDSLRLSSEQLNQENDELVNDYHDLAAENEDLKRTLEENRRRTTTLVRKANELLEERDILVEQLEDCRENMLDPDEVSDIIQKIRTQMRKKSNDDQKRRETLQDQVSKLAIESKTKQELVTSLTKDKNKLEGEMQEAKMAVVQLDRERRAQLSKLAEYERRLGIPSTIRASSLIPMSTLGAKAAAAAVDAALVEADEQSNEGGGGGARHRSQSPTVRYENSNDIGGTGAPLDRLRTRVVSDVGPTSCTTSPPPRSQSPIPSRLRNNRNRHSDGNNSSGGGGLVSSLLWGNSSPKPSANTSVEQKDDLCEGFGGGGEEGAAAQQDNPRYPRNASATAAPVNNFVASLFLRRSATPTVGDHPSQDMIDAAAQPTSALTRRSSAPEESSSYYPPPRVVDHGKNRASMDLSIQSSHSNGSSSAASKASSKIYGSFVKSIMDD